MTLFKAGIILPCSKGNRNDCPTYIHFHRVPCHRCLILSACGAASNKSVVATSVAMTVQAGHTEEARPTPTTLSGSPTSSILPSLTPVVTQAPPDGARCHR